MPRLPLAARDVHSEGGAARPRQTQRTPAVNLTHAHTTDTQRCQALGNHEQPPPYPQIALRQNLKAANEVTLGKPRHTVALHALTGQHILLQKALYPPALDTSLLICGSVPARRTALVCLPRGGVTRWLRVLTAPANSRGAP